jgi:quercetin dioxygenase-like cupin family protein
MSQSHAAAEELLGKVLDPADLVEYQEGAVVSRTILEQPTGTGTITLFAFDTGQGLSEHTAPFDALVQVLDGVATISLSGRPQQVNAGQFLIMPADEPHALRADQRFKMMLVMIRSGEK